MFPGVTGETDTSGDDPRCCGDMIAGYSVRQTRQRSFYGCFQASSGRDWDGIDSTARDLYNKSERGMGYLALR